MSQVTPSRIAAAVAVSAMAFVGLGSAAAAPGDNASNSAASASHRLPTDAKTIIPDLCKPYTCYEVGLAAGESHQGPEGSRGNWYYSRTPGKHSAWVDTYSQGNSELIFTFQKWGWWGWQDVETTTGRDTRLTLESLQGPGYYRYVLKNPGTEREDWLSNVFAYLHPDMPQD